MANAAVTRAELDGRLRPGGTVVEYTAGTTGVSLGLVCAAKRYGLEIVFSEAFSEEKRRTMQAFGARVTDVPSDNKKITEALIKGMINAAAEISRRPGHWYCDQLNNHDAIEGYIPLGEEIWQQTDGRIDAFVHSVSTAHSIHGVTEALGATEEKSESLPSSLKNPRSSRESRLDRTRSKESALDSSHRSGGLNWSMKFRPSLRVMQNR